MAGIEEYTHAIKLGGLEYRAGQFVGRQFAALNQWLREAFPSPIAIVKPELEGLSDPERLAILVRAYESMEGGRWPVEWGSPLAKLAVISKPGGREAFVGALLGERYPNLTPAQVEAIARAATIEEIGNALAVAEGIDVIAEVEAMVDPKALAAESMSRPQSDGSPSALPANSDSHPMKSEE